MKKFGMGKTLFTIMFLCSTATASLANEVEGEEAKNIFVSGEVVGMALFDSFFKEIFLTQKKPYSLGGDPKRTGI